MKAVVQQNFNGKTMAGFIQGLEDRVARQVLRKATSKAGTILAREIRVQIKRRNMPYSRARNAAERRKSRERGDKPLIRTISKRSWSRPAKGLIGCVVGPTWPAGAHGHLVEFGHKITGHAALRVSRKKRLRRIGRFQIKRSGDRTKAHLFQTEAMKNVQRRVYAELEAAMRVFMAKQGIL